MNHFVQNKSQATKGLEENEKQKRRKECGQVNSKSSVNTEGLKRQRNKCIFVLYTFKNICPKCYNYGKQLLPEISSKWVGKPFLVKITNKMLLPIIRIL